MKEEKLDITVYYKLLQRLKSKRVGGFYSDQVSSLLEHLPDRNPNERLYDWLERGSQANIFALAICDAQGSAKIQLKDTRENRVLLARFDIGHISDEGEIIQDEAIYRQAADSGDLNLPDLPFSSPNEKYGLSFKENDGIITITIKALHDYSESCSRQRIALLSIDAHNGVRA